MARPARRSSSMSLAIEGNDLVQAQPGLQMDVIPPMGRQPTLAMVFRPCLHNRQWPPNTRFPQE